MKATHFLPLVIALAFFGTCARQGPRRIAQVISKKEAAAKTAQEAKLLAEKLRQARRANNWQQVKELEKKGSDLERQLDQSLEEVRQAKRAFGDASEMKTVATVEKELEGLALGTTLAREIEDDAARLEKEFADDVARMERKGEKSLREQCLSAIRGIPKSDVCFYLQTYASAQREPTEEEWKTHSETSAVKCFSKLPRGFSQRNSGRSLMDAVKNAPDSSIKLQVAAAHLACL
jgi:hypothetical protein